MALDMRDAIKKKFDKGIKVLLFEKTLVYYIKVVVVLKSSNNKKQTRISIHSRPFFQPRTFLINLLSLDFFGRRYAFFEGPSLQA